MVALLGCVGRLDEVIVLDEVRVPLAGLAAEKPVEALEPLAERPGFAVAALGDIRLRDVVVLAEPEGAEATVLEDLGEGGGLWWDAARTSPENLASLP